MHIKIKNPLIMNLTRVAAVAFLLFTFIGSKAQTWQKTDLGIKTSIANQRIEIQFYSPSIVRVVKTPVDKNFAISIWNSFGPQTKQYRDLEKIEALMNFKTWPESGSEKWPPNYEYPSGVRVYDAYNPAARDIFWKYINAGLFSIGIDGWWMDSSEPDHLQF
jgi:alpha-D-xyloside xylohydrolase